MTKYVYANLVDFLKQDAKVIKKHCKEKNIHLSKIQTELAKFFGYRHFHELEIFHSKSNIFSSTETHLDKLTRDSFEKLKSEYNELFTSFSDFIEYDKNIFDKIKPLWSTVIFRDSKDTIHYNTAKYYPNFIFNNTLFEDFMNIYARKNSYSDPHLEFHVINFNNLIFDILKFVKSDNYSKDYKNYISFNNLNSFLNKNTKFKSVYLDNYNILMSSSNEEMRSEQHGYIAMFFSEFCRHPFIGTESKSDKDIIVKDLINDEFNHCFHYYDGLPKLINIIFDHVAILVKKYDSERISELSNRDKIKLFSNKNTGLMISKELNYDLVKEYLTTIDVVRKNNPPSIWFIDNNDDEIKDIIFEEKFASKRAQLNSGNFREQYYRIITKTAVDIFIINSNTEGFELKYVKQAVETGHLVFLLDPEDKFCGYRRLLSENTSVIELS